MATGDFYHSAGWRKMRERILRRDKYLCRECLRYGKRTDAETVHHVFPLADQPALALKGWNLISLCGQCHNKMHDRTTDAITGPGLRWQQRVSPLPSDRKTELFGTGEGRGFQ